MQNYRKILITFGLLFAAQYSMASTIEVTTFDQLMNTNPASGDTIQVLDNLTSDINIGEKFLGIDINFDGQNHKIDGLGQYGGFVINDNSAINQIRMTNLTGQIYSNSHYAGALYNQMGSIDITNSFFTNNSANSGSINFGIGGAIYNLSGGTINVDSTLFEGNYSGGASAYGGAIANGYLSSAISTAYINNSIFKNNYGVADPFGQGGAIYNNGNIEINNTQFIENHLQGSSGSLLLGGALYNSGNMTVNSSSFDGNYFNEAVQMSVSGSAIANTGTLNIANSVFTDNKSVIGDGSVISGGTIYNANSATIEGSVFSNNESNGGSQGTNIYGGVINNYTDSSTLVIKNSTFNSNVSVAGEGDRAWGGVIYNDGDATIENSTIENNSISGGNNTTVQGGAIYNTANGTVNIIGSNIENNKTVSTSENALGGGIYNLGTIIIENSNLENNYGANGKLNDIYNDNGIITVQGDGTTNILSGIAGSGTVNKNGSGVFNLGGINENYTGNFNFEEGTINLLKNASYFSAANTVFNDGVNFNMQNGQINNINYGNLTLNGQSNLFADANLQSKIMDTISASSINGSGNLFVKSILIEGVPEGEKITIPFANSTLKNYVSYQNKTIETPIYNYFSSYDNKSGDFNFTREGFNPSILVSPVAAQLGGYLVSLETYKNAFSNLDMVMIENQGVLGGFENKNKIASVNNFTFSPLLIPEERRGIWFKPYSVFENVPIKNGPDVSNVIYGGIVGGESNLIKLKNNWYSLYGAYFGYNGSHQAYLGNDIYNNGGLFGLTGAVYKKNFFSIVTANVGANSAKAHTSFGSDDFNMLNTGLAQKTGFNFPILNNRLILQPSIMASYTFINTFSFTTASNVHINTKPINALHIEPSLKFIGNFKDYLQPYLAVSFAWNLIDKAKFQANDVYLPDLSIKPYVQYGFGVQKRFKDRVTAFFEGMIRNGGRNGIALVLGLRISI
ncbi:TPA: hypothetical protein IAA92_08105 [Candidatus Galligastranaerophilus intestinigallinarum]|nr:hypothetical protein [Candidatus Galligastranaerophilus intestinigallinarum]